MFNFYTLLFPLQGYLYHNYFGRGNMNIRASVILKKTIPNIQRPLFNMFSLYETSQR